ARTLLDRRYRRTAGRLGISGQKRRRSGKTPSAAGRAERARPGIRATPRRRMHLFCARLRLSQDHALDAEHSGWRPQDLPERGLYACEDRAASQFWAKPDRRDLGTRTVTPPRRITRGLMEYYKRKAHRLRAEAYRNMGRAFWRALKKIMG